ncbi:MAG: hypothetical protein P9X24_20085 [Candidatus Hatepunaea meridiana]|nr:hypothetical protein [Candidatus Hatepunaea meridiana]
MVVIFIELGSNYVAIGHWLTSGIVIGLLYLFLYITIFRYNMALIPFALAVPSLLSKISSPITYPHPVGIQVAIVAFVLTALFAIYWTKMLDREVSG